MLLRSFVGKSQTGQPGATQLAGGCQDFRAELPNQPLEQCRRTVDHLPADPVGINHSRSKGSDDFGCRRFAGTNLTSDTDVHGRKLTQRKCKMQVTQAMPAMSMYHSKNRFVPHLTGGFRFDRQAFGSSKPTRWVGYSMSEPPVVSTYT